MDELELIDFIQSKVWQGVPEEEIRQKMMADGWDQKDIDNAFSYVQKKPKSRFPVLDFLIRHRVGITVPLLLFSVIIFWLNFTHYQDSSFGCDIEIGTDVHLNNWTVKASLEALKQAMPEKYREVCAHVTMIKTTTSCEGFGRGCYRGRAGEIYVSTAPGQVLESAEIIVHELCHLRQDEDGRERDDKECYMKSDEALKMLSQF